MGNTNNNQMEAIYAYKKGPIWNNKLYYGPEVNNIFEDVNRDAADCFNLLAIYVAIRISPDRPFNVVWRVCANTNDKFRKIFIPDMNETRYKVCVSRKPPVNFKYIVDAVREFNQYHTMHMEPDTIIRLVIIGNGMSIDSDGIYHHTMSAPIILDEIKK